MQVSQEDVTVAWGQAPHHLDQQFGRWRMAVFQDVQESLDRSKYYFLYDPVSDEQSGTSGRRKGNTSLVVFDVGLRCFSAELPIQVQGTVKFLFALKTPSPQGGTAFVLVTEEAYDTQKLHIWRLDLSGDGLSVTGLRPLLPAPLTIQGEYICSMREDAPELVVLGSPGLQVWRVNALADQPQDAVGYFQVNGAELSHFYDAFLSMGNVYLLSSSPDGHLDESRVHVMSLAGQGQVSTHNCLPDPSRGMPCARRQAAIDSVSGYILVAGGELDNGTRLVDYWVLDVQAFRWTQIPAQMPVPLIEPRLTAGNSGECLLWGDFDQPLPGMPEGTHLRLIKIRGLAAPAPPPYQETEEKEKADGKTAPTTVYPSLNQPASGYPGQQPAPAPGFNPAGPGVGAAPPYPGAATGPQPGSYQPPAPAYHNVPDYPRQQPPQPVYSEPTYEQPQSSYGQPQPQGYGQGGQTAYYPPQKQKKDKDCVVM